MGKVQYELKYIKWASKLGCHEPRNKESLRGEKPCLLGAPLSCLVLVYHSEADLPISQSQPELQQPAVGADTDRQAPRPEASHAQAGTNDQALAAELEKTEPEIPGLGQSLTSM